MNKYNHFSKASKSTIFARVSGSTRMCLSKRTYKDYEESINAIEEVKKTKGWSMRSYNCPYCKQWHLSRIKD